MTDSSRLSRRGGILRIRQGDFLAAKPVDKREIN
jgi:hypothetical protein